MLTLYLVYKYRNYKYYNKMIININQDIIEAIQNNKSHIIIIVPLLPINYKHNYIDLENNLIYFYPVQFTKDYLNYNRNIQFTKQLDRQQLLNNKNYDPLQLKNMI